MLFTVGATSEQGLNQDGSSVTLSASGDVEVETGAYYGDSFEPGTGEIRLTAEDMGGRVTPLPPHDKLTLKAIIMSGGSEFEVSVEDAMISHPLGQHTTWWGVGLDVDHHGESGIGPDKLPSIRSEVAAFGFGDVSFDGQPIATGVPVHVMTAESGLPNGARLELDVGMEGADVPGLPAGHLRVLWSSYDADIEDPHPMQYLGGGVILVLLLGAMLALVRRAGNAPG